MRVCVCTHLGCMGADVFFEAFRIYIVFFPLPFNPPTIPSPQQSPHCCPWSGKYLTLFTHVADLLSGNWNIFFQKDIYRTASTLRAPGSPLRDRWSRIFTLILRCMHLSVTPLAVAYTCLPVNNKLSFQHWFQLLRERVLYTLKSTGRSKNSIWGLL